MESGNTARKSTPKTAVPAEASRKRKAHDDSPPQQQQPPTRSNKRTKTNRTAPTPTKSTSTSTSTPNPILNLFVFGAGDGGELGLGARGRNASKPRLNQLLYYKHPSIKSPSPSPSEPTAQYQVTQFACGGMHTVAITADNKVISWGVNDNGALGRDTAWEGGLRDADGDGDSDDEDGELNPREATPGEVKAGCLPVGCGIVQVAAGDSCSFALTGEGEVYGWGSFRDPEGNARFGCDNAGKLIEKQLFPLKVAGLKNITQIACGANHALALDSSGVIWGWGSGDQHQLGRRLFGRNSDPLKPRRIEIFRQKARYIAAGEYHGLAIDDKGNVWGWGLNNYGQAGDAASAGTDAALLPHPVKIKDLCGRGVTVLDGGAHHSAAITQDGICLAWGRMDSGQLGIAVTSEMLNDRAWIRCDKSKSPRICLRPTEVHGIGKARRVACGTGHTIFVGADGLAYSTGFGPMGQLGLGSDVEEVKTPQQLKSKHIDGEIMDLAGAGGQFSMIASRAGNAGKGSEALTK